METTLSDDPFIIATSLENTSNALESLVKGETLDLFDRLTLQETADIFAKIDWRFNLYNHQINPNLAVVATSIRPLYFQYMLDKKENVEEKDFIDFYKTLKNAKLHIKKEKLPMFIDLLNFISRNKFLEAQYGKPKDYFLSA